MATRSGLSVTPGEKMVFAMQGLTIEAFQGDLTQEKADIVVNPTSRRMLHDKGLAKSISAAAGSNFVTESNLWLRNNGSLDAGDTAYTSGGNLPVKYVIHTVGTNFLDDCNQDEDTASAILQLVYTSCFERAKSLQVDTIAFPAVSTGQGRVPARVSAGAALTALANLVQSDSIGSVNTVRFIDSDPLTSSVFADEIQTKMSLFPDGVCFKAKSNRLPLLLPAPSISNDGSKLSHLSYPNGSEAGESSESGDMMDIDDNMFGDSDSNNIPNGVKKEENNTEEEKACPICMEEFSNATPQDPIQKLEKCGHRFHKSCIQDTFSKMQPKCPICQTWYGIPEGNQPRNGHMSFSVSSQGSVPGFSTRGYITINYGFPGGVQGPEHPRPGVRYSGTSRVAFLPNNEQGQIVLNLLRKAFEHRLVFTVGDSHTTGAQNTVVWNNIHHKTNLHGGAQGFGYPDPGYLDRVEDELAAAGITRDMLKRH